MMACHALDESARDKYGIRILSLQGAPGICERMKYGEHEGCTVYGTSHMCSELPLRLLVFCVPILVSGNTHAC